MNVLAKVWEKIPNKFDEDGSDQFARSTGKILTLIFWVGVVASTIILALFFGLQETTQVIITSVTGNGVPSQGYKDYLKLLDKLQRDDLKQDPVCTCTKPSIPYSSFIQYAFVPDDMCIAVQMDYVDSTEFLNVTHPFIWPNDCPADRVCQPFPWPMLMDSFRSLCGTAQLLIQSSLDYLVNSRMVTPRVLREDVLVAEIETKILEEKIKLPITFLHPYSWVKLWAGVNLPFKIYNGSITYHNETVHGATPVDPVLFTGPNDWFGAGWPPLPCDCRLDWRCAGCDTMDFILYADLHNRTHYEGDNMNATNRFLQILDQSAYPNAGAGISGMFIKDFNYSVSFENYFYACAPAECNYNVNKKPSALVLATVIFGLVGGITSGLDTVLAVLYKIIVKVIRPRFGSKSSQDFQLDTK